MLNDNIEDLKNVLSKFTQGRDTLDKILKSQNQTFERVGIGYKPFSKEFFFKKTFVHASSNHSHLICHYYGRKGHISSSRPAKRNSFVRMKKEWVLKNIPNPNSYGPKKEWVLKAQQKSNFCRCALGQNPTTTGGTSTVHDQGL